MKIDHLKQHHPGRVYLVMPVLIPAGRGLFAGGNMNSMMNSGAELASRGYRIHVVAGHYENGLSNSRKWGLEWARVHPINLHPDRRGFARGTEFLAKASIRILRKVKSDTSAVFHVHSGYPQFGFLCGLARFAKRVKTIQTLYCPLEDRVDDRSYWGLSPNLIRPYLIRNDAVVAISHNIKRSLLSLGVPDSKIWVIPPAVSTDKYHQNTDGTKERKKLSIDSNTKLLLYSGNATRTKGFEDLVEAFIRLRRSRNDVHLLYALQHQYSKDAEPVISRLESQLDRETGPSCYTRLGIVENMPELIAAADIFVSPLRDTYGPADYPISILEAMASGKCVLTTNVGGIPEFITDNVNGRLVPPGNVDILEYTLQLLLSSEEMRAELGRRASFDIRDKYTPAKIADMTDELYRSLWTNG